MTTPTLHPVPAGQDPKLQQQLERRLSQPIPQAMTLADKLQYCNELAQSFLLPKQFRGRPANVLWAVEYGAMLGLPAMAAINGIHIIDGKPTASAAIISALVRKAGHRLRVSGGYDDKGLPFGHAEIVRCDDPDFTFKSTWTIARAVRAQLCQANSKDGWPYARSKDTGRALSWELYPEAMTKHRAVTEAARDGCEEALCGIHYTPEELGAEVDKEGELVAYPEGSPERIADERAQAFAHAQKLADTSQVREQVRLQARRSDDGQSWDASQDGGQDGGQDGIVDADVIEDLPDRTDELGEEQRHELLIAEIEEISQIRGTTFEETATPLARGHKHIAELSYTELNRSLGSARFVIVNLLREQAQKATDPKQADELIKAARSYHRYTRARPDGDYPVAAVEDLFGRPSLAARQAQQAAQQDTHEFTAPAPSQSDADPALCAVCGQDGDAPQHATPDPAAEPAQEPAGAGG